MALQDLQQQFPIIDVETGKATDYFMRLIKDNQAQIDSNESGLASKVPNTRKVDTGAGLSGGGDLSQDRTLILDAGFGDLNDVDMTTTPPTDGQIPIWDNVASLWLPGNQTGGGVADGDYGDITVSGSGLIWDIDSGVVGTTELADDSVTSNKLADTAVTPGSYTNADITIDAKGRITDASNGTSKFPLVDGSIPPNLVYEEDGSLVYVEI